MYIRNAILIRVQKIPRQPKTGFTLLGAHQATECAAPVRLMFQLLRYSKYISCLETSQTRDSAGFQVSLSKNQICLQMSVFR
ncbi:hypothetical protein CSKR_108996 [Clonorchis sinensis]|uniref:Uncharacterized protein n=1 Tax=Clonorchis sinensis TaxID=79923 RepID=A0A3R7FTW1_CLOSI|nr:hypothetical protein CSKR_108996 [Clonorchis sinensis]